VNENARAACTYLTVQRKVPSRDSIFVGRTIGTGKATETAKEHSDAGGLILTSVYEHPHGAGPISKSERAEAAVFITWIGTTAT